MDRTHPNHVEWRSTMEPGPSEEKTMHLKPISAVTAATLLVLASLACNTITGGGLNNAQATVNAALTAAVSGNFAATADAAKATAGALLNTPGEGTATPKPT